MSELSRDESSPYLKQPTPDCAHYWIIEPANSPVSLGVCQVCREVREFKNFADGDTEGWSTNKRGVHPSEA